MFWRIKPGGASDYLFNIQQPEGTVKAVGESAMREIIGTPTPRTATKDRDRLDDEHLAFIAASPFCRIIDSITTFL